MDALEEQTDVASFAVLELSPEEVRAVLYDAVTGQVCQELAVPRGRLA